MTHVVWPGHIVAELEDSPCAVCLVLSRDRFALACSGLSRLRALPTSTSMNQ